jgi:hypothetical protein
MSSRGSLDPDDLAWIKDKTGKSASIIKEVHAEFRWELIKIIICRSYHTTSRDSRELRDFSPKDSSTGFSLKNWGKTVNFIVCRSTFN